MDSEGYRVAVVGATGLVGREILNVLDARQFPISELRLLASQNSAGEIITWKNHEYSVGIANKDAFDDLDIVLMSAGSAASKILAPLAKEKGAVVIDNSSQWRMDDSVPLVVPEVNAEAATEHQGIIANPNCSTIQMVVALAPLHRAYGLKRVVVSTYQAVSGAGKKAMDELGAQVSSLFSGRDPNPTSEVFPRRIAFNCLPQIDVFMDDRYTKEEHKMRFETSKILGDEIGVCATCVRVPVFNGHAESIVAEFEKEINADDARKLLRESSGLIVLDNPFNEDQTAVDTYPTQMDATGSDSTYVGRIRQDPTAPNSLALWCVADNLLKGAASNAVQIAELLVDRGIARSAK